MPPQTGSGAGSQFIELPDSTPDNPSYGEFPANQSDADIHRQLTVAFPDHFKELTKGQPTIMRRADKGGPPAAGQVPSPNMHKSFLFGDPNDNPDDEAGNIARPLMEMVKQPVHDAATMTRAGYQSMVKGITGHPYLGEPPSMEEFMPAATNTALAMAGGMESEGAPRLIRQAESAPPPRSTPGAYGRSSGRTGSGIGGGAGTASGLAADIADLMTPKWMKGLKILNKHFGTGAEGAAEDTGNINRGAPVPNRYGTPMEKWGGPAGDEAITHHDPVPGERTGQPYQPDPRFPRSARPIPQRNPPLQLTGGGSRPNLDQPRQPLWKTASTSPEDKFEWPDNYKSASKMLTRNNGGGANYSAEDLAKLKANHGFGDQPKQISDAYPDTKFNQRVRGSTPIDVYHGTSSSAAKLIKKEGLRGDANITGGIDPSGAVNVTDNPDYAEGFADIAATGTKSKPVVFKTQVPRGKLMLDKGDETGNAATVRGGHIPASRLVKVSKDVIGKVTAKPRTPGEPLQHGFNPKPAEDLGLKVRSDVERRQGPLPRGGGGSPAKAKLQRKPR